MDRLDVSYERVYMATEVEVYFTIILDSLLYNNEHHGKPVSSKKLQEAFSRVVAGAEGGGKYAKRNVNDVTMYTLFQSPVTTKAQKKDLNVTNER